MKDIVTLLQTPSRIHKLITPHSLIPIHFTIDFPTATSQCFYILGEGLKKGKKKVKSFKRIIKNFIQPFFQSNNRLQKTFL